MVALAVSIIGVVVLLVLYVAVAVLLARAVVYPQRARPTEIIDVDTHGDVVLSANPLTRFMGILGLLYDGETRLTVLAPAADIEEEQGHVVRRLAASAADHRRASDQLLARCKSGSTAGYIRRSPAVGVVRDAQCASAKQTHDSTAPGA